MKPALTKRQEAVLRFVEAHTRRMGYPPTVRETARHLGIKGISAVKKHLDALEKKGRISRRGGARTIELAGRSSTVSVPILGQVAAGQPVLAEENILGTLALDRSLVRGGRNFLLRVKGDSMIEAGILEGDHVIVKVQTHAENGDIVVALLEDEATVKRFYQRGNRITLQPANPDYAPIVPEPGSGLRILGRVTGVMRF
ncbi:MAG TPA: transcriptional repressor LexA [Nitrospiria bacterium]